MNIQTFQDGELVEEREVEGAFLPPNIFQFNTQMLFNPSYIKLVTNAQDSDAKSRLELSSVRLELKPEITLQDLQIFKVLWDSLVISVPTGILIAEDAIQYNQIAKSSNMPFKFGADFKMEIITEFVATDTNTENI